MLSTTILLTTLLLLIGLGLLFQAIFLRWGVRWASKSHVPFRKALVVAIVMQLIVSIVWLGASWCEAQWPAHATAIALADLVLQIFVSSGIIAAAFKLPFLRGVQAWLLTLIPGIAMIAFLFFIYRPFVSEAYVVPANSMAPTILGEHASAACPRCGAPAYGSRPDEWTMGRPDGLEMICSKELKSCNVPNYTSVGWPDRILVSKLIAPRRWDLIVFRLPADPAVTYVKRLVGMPGEELLIRDGAVWIDGEKTEPPEELRGIEYLSSLPLGNQRIQGAGTSPVKLADDEFFVLGDFSAQSSDSRFWQVGAPGHPPFAVPKSHLVGVVTHTYWPISRWRAFR